MIPFVDSINDIITNIRTLEGYLHSENADERAFALNIIQKGRTQLVYFADGENHFAPSRFLGYKNISKNVYLENDERDNRDTNPVMVKLIGKHFFTSTIEGFYQDYTKSIGVQPNKNKRHYWRVKDDMRKNFTL